MEDEPPPADRHARLRLLLDDWVRAGIDADGRVSTADADSIVTAIRAEQRAP
jgi:hypothetical protein